MQERTLNNTNGIKENADGSYSIATVRNFTKIIKGNSFVIGVDEKEKELIVYNNKLEIIHEKHVYPAKVQEYDFGKRGQFFVVANDKILTFKEDNVIWIEIPKHVELENYSRGEVLEIFCLDKKFFFVEAEYTKGSYDYKIFFRINIENKIVEPVVIINESYNHIFQYDDSRFITIDQSWKNVYDLYTGRCYNFKCGKIVHPNEIQVMYSSKEIISIKYRKSKICYLYINGECVYQYDVEENNKIIKELNTNIVRGRKFSTVIVRESMFIWTEGQEPEVRKIY